MNTTLKRLTPGATVKVYEAARADLAPGRWLDVRFMQRSLPR